MNLRWTAVFSASALILSFATVAAAGTRAGDKHSSAASTPPEILSDVAVNDVSVRDVAVNLPVSVSVHSTPQVSAPQLLTAAAVVMPPVPTPNRSASVRALQIQSRIFAQKWKLQLEAEALAKAKAKAAAKKAAQEKAAKKAAAKKATLHTVSTKKRTVVVSRSASLSSAGGNIRVGAADVALHYIGVPYRWAGSSPSGFDCSGLVKYAYAREGVTLPHSSSAMYHMGQPLSRTQLSVGDLVFFNTDGPGASHVGIYVGGGRFVDASGSHVQVDSLSGYWASHYIGARRL